MNLLHRIASELHIHIPHTGANMRAHARAHTHTPVRSRRLGNHTLKSHIKKPTHFSSVCMHLGLTLYCKDSRLRIYGN